MNFSPAKRTARNRCSVLESRSFGTGSGATVASWEKDAGGIGVNGRLLTCKFYFEVANSIIIIHHEILEKGNLPNDMMAYLQPVSDDLQQVGLLRLELKRPAQANGFTIFQNRAFPVISTAIPFAAAREPEKP